MPCFIIPQTTTMKFYGMKVNYYSNVIILRKDVQLSRYSCRMGFINPSSLLPALHLSRNAAKVSESLKISDQRMAKLY